MYNVQYVKKICQQYNKQYKYMYKICQQHVFNIFFLIFFFLTICLTIDVGKVFIESCVAPGCDVIQGSAMVKGDEAGFLCHILEKRKIIYTIQYVRIVNYFTDTWSLQRHYYLLGFVYSPNSNILKILK